MKIDLTDRSAVVTGSTAGIGHAIARGLAGAGASVVLNGRHQPDVDQAVAALKQAVPGAEVRGVAADLGTEAGCDTLAGAVAHPDILVNNVGFFGPADFFEADDDLWQQILAVNFLSGMRLSRALVPGMVDRGWGRVIFLSSELALNIPADMIHYGVTKTAYLALSRGLAKRLAGTGVTANAILPGPTLSRGLRRMPEADGRPVDGDVIEDSAADFVADNRPGSLIRRAASVDEVANLAVYLASPLSSATTGAALRVDGGVVDSIA